MSAIDEEAYVSGVVVRNGVHVPATAANVRLAQPAGMVTYTFNAPFSTVQAGQHFTFRKGQTVHITAAQATAFAALGANITLVA